MFVHSVFIYVFIVLLFTVMYGKLIKNVFFFKLYASFSNTKGEMLSLFIVTARKKSEFFVFPNESHKFGMT